ncbi:grasp-with-spasm system SPASM domain peptide maturase [Tenacibaculum xiamenense]|uniref:grasp-with-spasm system SPASM domain peptide maturase n=1 Tax=Tenacibaculum xiamenense TaxID=1261553 RepID=UPI00389614C5
MKDSYFVLFANCIPVKGKNRSVICDLHNHQLKLIPNDLYNILTRLERMSIDKIKKSFNNNFDEVIDEYFAFLNKNDFGFYTDDPKKFPKLNLKWNTPRLITNAIIDVNDTSSHNFNRIFNQLEKVTCKHLQIRFFCNVSLTQLEKINILLKKIESCVISVDFILPNSNSFKIESINQLILDYPRITSFFIYNADKDLNIKPVRNSLNSFIFTKENINDHLSCGVINSNYFSINVKNFTESIKHNSCLNKKISIDVNGDIKNCPSMPQSFGNIKNTTLQEALDHRDFKKYWNLTKDVIDVCKDCEFRYVCTDCRAYKENPEDDYSKPLKCGYSPYTNKWEKWSANPLKEKAIKYYGMQELARNDD